MEYDGGHEGGVGGEQLGKRGGLGADARERRGRGGEREGGRELGGEVDDLDDRLGGAGAAGASAALTGLGGDDARGGGGLDLVDQEVAGAARAARGGDDAVRDEIGERWAEGSAAEAERSSELAYDFLLCAWRASARSSDVEWLRVESIVSRDNRLQLWWGLLTVSLGVVAARPAVAGPTNTLERSAVASRATSAAGRRVAPCPRGPWRGPATMDDRADRLAAAGPYYRPDGLHLGGAGLGHDGYGGPSGHRSENSDAPGTVAQLRVRVVLHASPLLLAACQFLPQQYYVVGLATTDLGYTRLHLRAGLLSPSRVDAVFVGSVDPAQ